MDITSASPQAIRIKGKNAAFVANPLNIKLKTQADAVLQLSKNDNPDLSKVEEYRLEIRGAGEYEVAGAKITAVASGSDLCYYIILDSSELCVTSSSFLKAKKEGRECPVMAIYCNEDIDSGIITELSPRALVLFGEKAADLVKSLGKEAPKTSKFTSSPDKLPEEMQVVVLG